MADETIVNKLGFSVEDALRELQRLDNALIAAGKGFESLGTVMNAWNSQAGAALNTMKEMAAAAGKLASAMSKTGAGPTAPTAPATAASSGLWLPPGVAEEANKLKTALAGAGAAGGDAGNKIKTGMNDAGDATDKANQHADHLRVTFGTLGRIVVTQMIVRAMSQIRDALRGAVIEAIEFQRRIAEIETIAPKIGGSFASLTSEAAEFAKQFNIPLAQATEGLYETISDQFSGMSERANIMSAAMKLAKVGVMDFQDATTLLTGTLNAFGMTSEQAEAVAAKYFTTINLGHVRGKELADTMGVIIPIASQLGISLDELNAAMIAMTIGGMDSHKTVTALRGAMTAFLKPSEDMKKVIREMGFSSAEQVVQAKGFQGALQAVADASNNMASEIAKSFRNVRALTAELRLTGEGAIKVEEAMKALATSTPEMLNKIYEKFISTDSAKLTREINRLKITLTQDFGAGLTGALATVMQFVGGADRLSAAIQAIAAACVPAGVALVALAAKGAIAALALGPVSWTILGITAALSLLAGGMVYTTTASINETRRLAAEQRQATMEYLKNKEEELRKLREVEQKKMQEEDRFWEDRASKIRRSYFKALDDLRDKNKDLIDSDRQVMQTMISSQERVVAAYRNAAQAALRMVQESQNRRVGLEGQYADLLFKERIETQLRLEGAQKAGAVLRRSWELEAQANKMLVNAQTEADVQRAQAVAQRAESYLKEGAALAKEVGDSWLVYQAEQSIRTNLEGRLAAETKLAALQAARAQVLAAEAAKEQTRLDQMKVLMKDILADLQAFDKHGVKSPAALKEQQDRLTSNIKQFQELWMGGKQVDVAALLAFDQLQRRVTMALEGGVSETEVSKLYAAPETFAKFRSEIEQGVGPVRLMIEWTSSNLRLKEATKGMTAEETMAQYTQQLERARRVIENFDAMKGGLTVATDALNRSQVDIKAALDRWVNVGWIKDLNRFGGLAAVAANKYSLFPGRFQPIRDAVIALEGAIDKFNAPGAKPNTEDLEKLKAAYDLYLQAVKPKAASKAALNQFMQLAEGAVDAAQRVDTMQKGIQQMAPEAAEAAKERAIIQEALKAVEAGARRAQESTEGAKTEAQGAHKALTEVSQINMGGLVNQIELLADAMWSVAAASQSVELSMPEAPMLPAAHGGMAWKFLAGGGPVGTDVIPAMLSPGEVVINAASARKFAAQLTAINAGVQPVYRSEGGSVTNIGDINVTVNGGGTSRQTARSIAAELRRELRRGTATL